MRPALSAIGLCALASTIGCGSLADDTCNEYCACHGCSDRDYEDCIIRTEADLDIYDTYGCDLEAEELYACRIDRGYCQDGSWTHGSACDRRVEDLQWCVSGASLLRGQPQPLSGND